MTKTKAKSNGVILWEGRSLLDGSPIVAIATGLRRPSMNAKTGGMVQVFIIRSDMSPLEAIRTGADGAICGGCVHRGEPVEESDQAYKNRTCYVDVAKSVMAIWNAYMRGGYPRIQDSAIQDIGRDREVRLGAYGDPAAVPPYVWFLLLQYAAGWTGYTHQWADGRLDPGLQKILMASVESPEERAAANILGWRTFRVDIESADDRATRGMTEAQCPATMPEKTRKVQCIDCMQCNGAGAHAAKADIVVPMHGARASVANRQNLIARVAA